MEKPPTQRVGVQGIASAKQEISQAIDWYRLATLPPFQQFAHLNASLPIGEVDDWIRSYLVDEIALIGEEQLFSDYCVWHEGKGSWPNETPMGQLKPT